MFVAKVTVIVDEFEFEAAPAVEIVGAGRTVPGT
jgi:hypothetical protein